MDISFLEGDNFYGAIIVLAIPFASLETSIAAARRCRGSGTRPYITGRATNVAEGEASYAA
jgi:hypothetical protein